MAAEKNGHCGALVVSLDFELMWGMRDLCRPGDPYAQRILNGREAVSRMLALFAEYDIAATWAIVGLLFAESQQEIRRFSPQLKPEYVKTQLNPYQEHVGEGEWDDPLHYAPSLIRQIAQVGGQEIATHTFSHFYCLEKGQTEDAFATDLDSALAIAKQHGAKIHSIVFPRNQHNPDYDEILLSRGIICYRSCERHPAYMISDESTMEHHYKPFNRMYRYADSFVNLSGLHLTHWEDVVEPSGLCNIPSSRFLRSAVRSVFLQQLRLKRIFQAMDEAAHRGHLFHLWWHPHNFGADLEDNLQGLRFILEHYSTLRQRHGMLSLNMSEAARLAWKEYTPSIRVKEKDLSWKENLPIS